MRRETRVFGWVGVPSEIDHLLSLLRSFSPVAVSKQLHYDKKKRKKERKGKQQTTIWWNAISVFKQDKKASDVAHSVDTPRRGELTKMKRRPRCFIMKLLVLWEKSRRATLSSVVNFSLGFALCSPPLTWHWAAERPESLHNTSTPRQLSLRLVFGDRTAIRGLVCCSPSLYCMCCLQEGTTFT